MDWKELKQRIVEELGYRIIQLEASHKVWQVFLPGTEERNYLTSYEEAWDWIPNWPKSSDIALQLPIPDGWRWEIDCRRTVGHKIQKSIYDVYLYSKEDPYDHPVQVAVNVEDLPQTICLLWCQYRKDVHRQEPHGYKAP